MGAVMKMKVLEGHLQTLKGFHEPKIQLEQYVTPPHIAAVALYTIQTQFEGIEGNAVLDAGCGAGALAAGAALLGAGHVAALDVDGAALDVLRENISEMELSNVDAVQCDFLRCDELSRWQSYFETVLMNPPFGTKNNSGMDMKFLRMATHLSCDTVFSFHKTSTRPHIEKKVREWGMSGSVVAQLRYELPASYRFHKKHSLDIAVDLWRVQHPQ